MRIIEKSIQLKRLADLIDKENTGNSIQLAKKVGFSRTHLFDVIDEFKQMGVEIYFNKDKQSYCYAGSHRLKISNPVTIIDECEIISTMGGYYITSNKLLKLLLAYNQ